MRRSSTRLIAALVIALGSSLFGTRLAAEEWDLNRTLAKVESLLPVAEKQSEIIVKMLASEKHRAKIEEEMALVFSGHGTPELKAQEAYLTRVLAQMGAPLSKTVIPEKLLGEFYSSGEVSILSPNTLILLARGGTGAYASPMYDKPENFVSDRQMAERVAAICTRVIEIQRPVQLAARQYLDTSEIKKNAFGNFGGGGEIDDVQDLYGLFLPNDSVHSDAIYLTYVEEKRPEFGRFNPAFLAYLKKQAQYLESIGFEMQFDSHSFGTMVRAVDTHLARLAETSDLSDLAEPAKVDRKKAGADDLPPPPDR